MAVGMDLLKAEGLVRGQHATERKTWCRANVGCRTPRRDTAPACRLQIRSAATGDTD